MSHTGLEKRSVFEKTKITRTNMFPFGYLFNTIQFGMVFSILQSFMLALLDLKKDKTNHCNKPD